MAAPHAPPFRSAPTGTSAGNHRRLTASPLHAMIIRTTLLVIASLSLVLAACGGGDNADKAPVVLPSGMQPPPATNADGTPPAVPFDPATAVVKLAARTSHPHDTGAYTQGLVVHQGRLLESTGIEGRSTVREVMLAKGTIAHQTSLLPFEFGEGIAAIGDRLWMLTWKGGRGHLFNARTLAAVDSFRYDGEGWGLTTDGSRLYLSDGSSKIKVVDPTGFRVERTIAVTEGTTPVYMLNELEWVRGELWANIYMTDKIARIEPTSGKILGYLDTSGLLTDAERTLVAARGGTANGIAYDSTRNEVLITGKLWPKLFVVPRP